MHSIDSTHAAGGAPAATETPGAPASDRGRPFGARMAALAGRPRFWVALTLAALLTVIALGRAVRGTAVEAPALRIPLPAFALTDHRGERFGLEQLRGRVWIADFIFTSCPTVCPKLTQRMKELQERGRPLGDALHLVSFTVDPETDTPKVLADYAAAQGLSLDNWTFLTGPLGEVESTVVSGFKIAMGKTEASPGIFSIFHGERFVLVDREGVIRGYYEASDEGLDAILRDAERLVGAR